MSDPNKDHETRFPRRADSERSMSETDEDFSHRLDEEQKNVKHQMKQERMQRKIERAAYDMEKRLNIQASKNKNSKNFSPDSTPTSKEKNNKGKTR